MSILPRAQAAQFSTDSSPTISSPVDDDSFLAGNSVLVSAPITGDAFAAGKNVTIKAKIGQSAYVVGTNVFVEGGVDHNLWTAGQLVTIEGDIGHDVYVAGKTVIIDPSTHIHGQLRVAAEDVTIAGIIDGDTYIIATSLATSATYGKNAKFEADQFSFNGGSVAGNLTYRTDKELTDFGNLKVNGKTNFEAISNLSSRNFIVQTALLGALAMFITGGAMILFAGRKVKDVTEMVQTKWAQSLGVGVAVLFLGPLLALALVLTNVGASLGLVVLALYAVAIYTSSVLAYMVVGMRGMKMLNLKFTTIWAPFILALIVLGVLQVIPEFASIILIAFFIGVILPTLGAEVLWWKSVLQGNNNAAP